MKIKDMLLNDIDRIPKTSDMHLQAAAAITFEQKGLWAVRSQSDIDVIVIHYISAIEHHPKEPYSLKYIIDIFYEYGVSSHYLIDRQGVVYRLVPDALKAWHAGGSIMPAPDNRQGVNDFSIGIELIATRTSGFTRKQYRSLAALSYKIETSNNKIMTYIGHEHIAGALAVTMGIRNDCKVDPGSLFDWNLFFRELESRRNTKVESQLDNEK